jgi:hypothetical protein
MRTQRKIKPGRPGTKKLVEQYGSKLVCVRYRYDSQLLIRYKTVEIIIEESPWIQRTKNFKAEEIVCVSVDRLKLKEIAIKRQVKLADAVWDSKQRVWEMRYDQAVQLGLEAQVKKRNISNTGKA